MKELKDNLQPAPPPYLPLPLRVIEKLIDLAPTPIKHEIKKTMNTIESAIREGSKGFRF